MYIITRSREPGGVCSEEGIQILRLAEVLKGEGGTVHGLDVEGAKGGGDGAESGESTAIKNSRSGSVKKISSVLLYKEAAGFAVLF